MWLPAIPRPATDRRGLTLCPRASACLASDTPEHRSSPSLMEGRGLAALNEVFVEARLACQHPRQRAFDSVHSAPLPAPRPPRTSAFPGAPPAPLPAPVPTSLLAPSLGMADLERSRKNPNLGRSWRPHSQAHLPQQPGTLSSSGPAYPPLPPRAGRLEVSAQNWAANTNQEAGAASTQGRSGMPG